MNLDKNVHVSWWKGWEEVCNYNFITVAVGIHKYIEVAIGVYNIEKMYFSKIFEIANIIDHDFFQNVHFCFIKQNQFIFRTCLLHVMKCQ